MQFIKKKGRKKLAKAAYGSREKARIEIELITEDFFT